MKNTKQKQTREPLLTRFPHGISPRLRVCMLEGRSSAFRALELEQHTSMHSLCLLWFLFLPLVISVQAARRPMKPGFYDKSCPLAESIVQSTIESSVRADWTIAPAVLRLHFHDCFVRGCDGSVLIIDGESNEKVSPSNAGLRGFEVIEEAKSRIEAVCPGVVSCADILALAAKEAVIQTGGPSWQVALGRRDGNVSLAEETSNMPSPYDSVAVLRKKFSAKGLSTTGLVALAGAHTIGRVHCQAFSYRLYSFNSTEVVDPTFSTGAVQRLRQLCPLSGAGTNLVALDTGSESSFDNSFFKNLRQGNGILESDQILSDNELTSNIVKGFASRQESFKEAFVDGMAKMSAIEVKTGNEGLIRNKCSAAV